jgi:hypothetical protein
MSAKRRRANSKILSVTQLPDGNSVTVRVYPDQGVRVTLTGKRSTTEAFHGGDVVDYTFSPPRTGAG